MKKYVALDKRSKKAQKAYYAEMRQTWNGVNPVTRTESSGREYNRRNEKRKLRSEIHLGKEDLAFCFL